MIGTTPQHDHRRLATLWRPNVEPGFTPRSDLRPAKPKNKWVSQLSGKVVS
jgi:hypothetical protein